jgi:hypothetical protein
MTQPWVYPFDLEQPALASIPLSAVPSGVRPWTLGPDLVINGDFGSASGWALVSGVSIGGGSLNFDGATSLTAGNQIASVSPSMSLQVGKSYFVTYTITGGTTNQVSVGLTVGGQLGTNGSTTGTYTAVLTPTVTANLAVFARGSTGIRTGSIDKITVQEVIYDWSWLGANLVTNGDFSSGLTSWGTGLAGSSTATATGGIATLTRSGGSCNLNQAHFAANSGKSYRVVVRARGTTGGEQMRLDVGSAQYPATLTTSWADYPLIVGSPTSATGFYNLLTDARTIEIDNITVQEIPGYPMTSPTAGGERGSARVNLLQMTEEFDNAAWTKSDSTVTPNAAAGPTGTTTADKLIPNAVSSGHDCFQTQSAIVGARYRSSVALKADGYRYAYVTVNQRNSGSFVGLVAYAIDLDTGSVGSAITGGTTPPTSPAVAVTSLGSGWYRVDVFATLASSGVNEVRANIGVTTNLTGLNSFSGDGTSGILTWGADLRLSIYTGTAYPSYQRVGDGSTGVFDYDHANFPAWWQAAATNAGMHTVGTLDLTATDAARMGVVAVKLSDVAAAAIAELSSTSSTTAGSLALFAPHANGTTSYLWRSRGTAGAADATFSSAGSPRLSALYGASDISEDFLRLFENGVQVGQNTADQGTGNYGNHRYYAFGRSLDSGASLPFPGRLATSAPHIVDATIVSETDFAEMIREDAAAVGHPY